MSKLNESFLLPIKNLVQLLSKTKIKNVIIGGISVGLLGKPRFTADVDAVILLDMTHIEKFVAQAAKFGFVPRLKDVVAFAQKSHVILLLHEESGIRVDLSIGMLPFEEEAIQRSKEISAEGVSFNIPTPEDLIVMKAIAHRPKDLEDIRSIVEAQEKLDVARIKHWVIEFSQVLEMPEIWNDIEEIIFPK